MTNAAALPTFDDVRAAAARLAGHAHRTPVLTSRTLDAATGAAFFLKCENLQRMGAFKFRGAYNALARFDGAQRRGGVVAFSSGNHAQAIALAASMLGLRAVIVMPHDAPASKVAATRGYLAEGGLGGEVVLYDRYTEDREAIGQRIAGERGATVIPPYDHPDVIAGQGTAALELFEQTRDGGPLDALFVCLGGGGLLSGCALAARALAPACRVVGVEPEAGDDGKRSFESGSVVRIEVPRTIADGAQTQALGRITFPLIRANVDAIETASDAELVEAMRFLCERLKIIVEPTGCLAFAAARRLAGDFRGKRIGVILSGGNVDLARFASLVGSPPR